jgi:hypothetical protein
LKTSLTMFAQPSKPLAVGRRTIHLSDILQ